MKPNLQIGSRSVTIGSAYRKQMGLHVGDELLLTIGEKYYLFVVDLILAELLYCS